MIPRCESAKLSFFSPPPLPTSGDADYSGAQAAVDADGQEIKEDSVVVDDVFGKGITHAIVPLEHADGVTTCAPTGSQRRIHVPPQQTT